MLSRRDFLKVALAGGGALLFPIPASLSPQSRAALTRAALRQTAEILDPAVLPKFVQPLVIPPVMPPLSAANGQAEYRVAVRPLMQQILPDTYPPTPVWGYGSTEHPETLNSPGFTFECRTGDQLRVTWVNGLVDDAGNFVPHLLPVDQTLHWADPAHGGAMYMGETPDLTPYQGPIPIATHIHGLHVADHSDGLPDAWFLPDAANIPESFTRTGAAYVTQAEAPAGGVVYDYAIDQPAATLWYHDHALGITRLNVYAGMAGFFIVRDEQEDALNLPGPAPQAGDPPGTRYYDIPIAIQDRFFKADGTLFYPDSRAFFDEYEGPFKPETPVPPIWNPEFFGNTIMVNGRTYPYLEVEPRLYRFRLLNGCNSRFLVLKCDQEVNFHQIGAEGGLLSGAPVERAELLMAPGERADVLVDFSAFNPGDEIILLNVGGDEPFGGFPIEPDVIAKPESSGTVMQFRVVELTDSGNPGEIPSSLPAIARLETDLPERTVTLNEEMFDPEDIPVAAYLGTNRYGPKPWFEEPTEVVQEGDTEIWNIVNLTVDAHPIHLHLAQFQVIERISIREIQFEEAVEAFIRDGSVGDPPDPLQYASGDAVPAHPWESGWKDTVIAYPGEITRIIAHFDLAGDYVWHCHVLEHEDNEMMRPLRITPRQRSAKTD